MSEILSDMDFIVALSTNQTQKVVNAYQALSAKVAELQEHIAGKMVDAEREKLIAEVVKHWPSGSKMRIYKAVDALTAHERKAER